MGGTGRGGYGHFGFWLVVGAGLFRVGGMEHHVYFWLKEEHRNEVDRAVFEKALDDLFAIRWVVGGRWGRPAPVPVRPVVDQSWDYALSMQFANVEGHDAYQEDPDHLAFVETHKNWWSQVKVMDMI